MLAIVQRGDRFQLSLTSGRRLDGSHVSIARKNLEWLGGGSVLGGHDRGSAAGLVSRSSSLWVSGDGNYEMAATRAPFAGSRETLAGFFFKLHAAVCESIGTMGTWPGAVVGRVGTRAGRWVGGGKNTPGDETGTRFTQLWLANRNEPCGGLAARYIPCIAFSCITTRPSHSGPSALASPPWWAVAERDDVSPNFIPKPAAELVFASVLPLYKKDIHVLYRVPHIHSFSAAQP